MTARGSQTHSCHKLGHRFLGSHGDEYEAASRQLNYLRERMRDGKLDEQGMYDAFCKLDSLVGQIPGDAFDPPVERIPAAKLIDHRSHKERIAEIVPIDVKGTFTRYSHGRRHPSVPLHFCRQIGKTATTVPLHNQPVIVARNVTQA